MTTWSAGWGDADRGDSCTILGLNAGGWQHGETLMIERLKRLGGQLVGRNPFGGTVRPTRIRLWSPGRPSLPFPHPWNYDKPLPLLATYYWKSEREEGFGKHNRYLGVPGFAPVFVTRDPRVIRAISQETGDKPGQFDRDTMPSSGIARATGKDSLLYSNGAQWKHQKKLATPPFARTTLFQPEQFHEFQETFRNTVRQRLEIVRQRISASGGMLRVALEPEIKAIMLEMLVNNFFGAEISYEEIRNKYVPGIEHVIEHIVRDTVMNQLDIPLSRMPRWFRGVAKAQDASVAFNELTDKVLEMRPAGRGLWKQFKSDAPDDALRANIRSFLAGALEATTSYASWALAHLSRDAAAQERLYQEVRDIDEYTPEALANAKWLGCVLDETLRLTPALYFHPRKATVDTEVKTSEGETLVIPKGTHIFLDIWHANRHEDHWGVVATGYPAQTFAPQRWETLAEKERGDFLHFGFGHGPRFCPGKSLGQLETALVVGGCVKVFEMRAVHSENPARAAVSTKPMDGVLVELRVRSPGGAVEPRTQRVPPSGVATKSEAVPSRGRCPFTGAG